MPMAAMMSMIPRVLALDAALKIVTERAGVLKRVDESRPKEVAGVRVVGRDTVDGYRFELENGGWLLIRFSGTEPLIRIYTEVPEKRLVPELLKAGRELAGLPE